MTTVRLLVNKVSEYHTYLELKKQRFRYKNCGRTFVLDTSLAEKHCFISKNVRWSILTRLKKNTPMTEIAHQKNLSVSSVTALYSISEERLETSESKRQINCLSRKNLVYEALESR